VGVKYALTLRIGDAIQRKTEEGEDGPDTRWWLRIFIREQDGERVCIDTSRF